MNDKNSNRLARLNLTGNSKSYPTNLSREAQEWLPSDDAGLILVDKSQDVTEQIPAGAIVMLQRNPACAKGIAKG